MERPSLSPRPIRRQQRSMSLPAMAACRALITATLERDDVSTEGGPNQHRDEVAAQNESVIYRSRRTQWNPFKGELTTRSSAAHFRNIAASPRGGAGAALPRATQSPQSRLRGVPSLEALSRLSGRTKSAIAISRLRRRTSSPMIWPRTFSDVEGRTASISFSFPSATRTVQAKLSL